MLLSQNDILAGIEAGRLGIEPFNEDNLTANGYMLTVDRIRIPKLRWTVQKGFIAISKLTAFRVLIKEKITLPGDLTADLFLAPVLSKKGVLASFSKMDAGFDGAVELTAFNSSSRTIDIASGDQFAEIVFVPVSTAAAREAAAPAREVPVTAPTVETPRLEPRDPRLGGEPCVAYGCIECCLETEMPLSNDDIKRIEGLGHKNFYENKGGWLVLGNRDGHCVFLDGRACLIYDARPEGCKFYPYVFNAEAGGGLMDRDCPHSSSFLAVEGMENDLAELVDRLTRERKRKRILRI